MDIPDLPLRIAHLVPTKAELAGVRGLAMDFPGISTDWPVLLRLSDNFNNGASNDWGVMRWLNRLSGTGGIALASSSPASLGGYLNMTTGTTVSSVAGIETRGTAATFSSMSAAVHMMFTTPATGVWSSGADNAIMRVGFKAQSATTHHLMLESDSGNSPHTWRVKWNPNSGGSAASIDTGAAVTGQTFEALHVYSLTLIGSVMNERVFGGAAGMCRAVVNAIGASNAVRMYDGEFAVAGTLFNPMAFCEVINKTGVSKAMLPIAAALWQLPGARTTF